jgi:hypothetical protein
MGQHAVCHSLDFQDPHHLPHDSANQALAFFDATSHDEAYGPARLALTAAERCPRCTRVLSQLHARIGSTLFQDDDPRRLARAFDAADREGCTLRLLAACIVLFGRPRVPVQAVRAVH